MEEKKRPVSRAAVLGGVLFAGGVAAALAGWAAGLVPAAVGGLLSAKAGSAVQSFKSLLNAPEDGEGRNG